MSGEQPHMVGSDGQVRVGAYRLPAEVSLPEVVGVDLDFMRIDHAVRLHFGPVEVVILGQFALRTSGAEERCLDPGQRGGLGPLLDLYPERLVLIRVDGDASLHLAFADGASIAVPRDERYEAWHIVGPDDALIVCSPAGSPGLDVWS